jgi:hypothetical protein
MIHRMLDYWCPCSRKCRHQESGRQSRLPKIKSHSMQKPVFRTATLIIKMKLVGAEKEIRLPLLVLSHKNSTKCFRKGINTVSEPHSIRSSQSL